MMTFCTIFDSNYLDKGITLYHSLERVCDDFKIYIFAFDELTYTILNEMNFSNMVIIPLEEYETDELRMVGETRDRGEYCWTFTPVIIEHVLIKCGEEICTYIDADMYFYHSPQRILDELIHSNYTVGVMGHRFANKGAVPRLEKNSGKFCVEFNTFKNEERALKLLRWWKQMCLLDCSVENCGDQRYISDWCDKYDFVYEYQYPGGGVAPWNMGDYKWRLDEKEKRIIYKKKEYDLIFYHFQGMQYSEDKRVKLWAFTCDMGMSSRVSADTIYRIYVPYLYETENVKRMLKEKYGLDKFRFGCKRKFNIYPFNLFKFMQGILKRVRDESVLSALNFVICVIRKKKDVISLEELENSKLQKYVMLYEGDRL